MPEKKKKIWLIVTDLKEGHQWMFECEADAYCNASKAIRDGASFAIVAKAKAEFKPGIEITEFE